jgi:hypothetical protein
MAYTSPIIPNAANIYNNQQPYPYPAQTAPVNMYYQPPYQQSFQITKVNGENGAKAFQMPPNSSIILLDESSPKVYIKETDGASYPKLSVYKLVPDTDTKIKAEDDKSKEQIKKLEERIAVLERFVTNSKAIAAKNEAKQKEKESKSK